MKTMHLCLDIRGALNAPSRWRGAFRHDDGRVMSTREIREALLDALSEGKRVLPCGDCPDFDYQTGCPGHPTEPAHAD